MVLLICKRSVSMSTYSVKTEFKFTFKAQPPKIADLEQACREHYGLGPTDKLSVAKYFPHYFNWKHLDPEEEITEKKKKKEVKFKGLNADLRKMPYILKDGDIIGVRFESENEDGKDDFQTEQDKILKEEFENNRKLRQQEDDMSKIGNKKGRHVEHNININLDEDEEIERIKAESLKDVQP